MNASKKSCQVKQRKSRSTTHEVAVKVGLTNEELYKQAGTLIDEKFGLYEGFEKAVKEGPESFTKIGVPENIAKAFTEVAEERIHVKMVKVKGTLEVRCMKPNGVKIIKEAFQTAKAEKNRAAEVQFYVVAAPKYSIEALAENYKRAEEVFQKAAQSVVLNVTKAGGQGTFRREK